MGQKCFIFHTYSLIIFAVFPKKYLNSLLHEYYQKLFCRITIFLHTPINSFLNICQKKNFFQAFLIFHLWNIAVSDICFSKKYVLLIFAVINFGYHTMYFWKALEE